MTGGIIEAIVDMEVSMSLIQVNVKVWKRCIDNNDHFNYFIFGIVDYHRYGRLMTWREVGVSQSSVKFCLLCLHLSLFVHGTYSTVG